MESVQVVRLKNLLSKPTTDVVRSDQRSSVKVTPITTASLPISKVPTIPLLPLTQPLASGLNTKAVLRVDTKVVPPAPTVMGAVASIPLETKVLKSITLPQPLSKSSIQPLYRGLTQEAPDSQLPSITLCEYGEFSMNKIGSDVALKYACISSNNTLLVQLDDVILGPASVVTQIKSSSIKEDKSNLYNVTFCLDLSMWGEEFESVFMKVIYLDTDYDLITWPEIGFTHLDIKTDKTCEYTVKLPPVTNGIGKLSILFL